MEVAVQMVEQVVLDWYLAYLVRQLFMLAAAADTTTAQAVPAAVEHLEVVVQQILVAVAVDI
jgi:hypothetical protein